MPVRIVQSKQNSRLKALRRALAQPGRTPDGLVGVEGPNLVEEALRAGVTIPCVFAAEPMRPWVEKLNLPPQTELLVVPSDILVSALTTETPQPVAALVEPPDWTWAQLLGSGSKIAPLVIVVAELQDPGNLGTILRSAEAFCASGLVCLPGTVSVWNPKAVRASAGSAFRVPVLYMSADDALRRLREAGVAILATTPSAARLVDLVDLASPVALVIGNEGSGVPADIVATAQEAVTIPCPGPVESLNAAVATSVLLYEASRQRTAKSGGSLAPRGSQR
jgi:TrmH family RNA methyltransferase